MPKVRGSCGGRLARVPRRGDRPSRRRWSRSKG